MGLFRRARGNCPRCGKQMQAEVGEKNTNDKVWSLTCTCGAKFSVPIGADWWMSYRDEEGRARRRKIGPDKRAAERVLGKVRVEIIEGSYIDRKSECRTTLRELMDGYKNSVEPNRDEYNVRRIRNSTRRLIEVFGPGRRIDRIDEDAIEVYRKKREAAGLAVATINRELSDFSAAMKWAVGQKLIRRKPRVRMPVPQNARSRFLTKTEAKVLIAACHEKIRPVVQAALGTGMRRGELLKMEWSWVDLGSLMINIPGSATKTGKGRHVPILGEMLAVLHEAGMRRVPGCQNVFHWEGKAISRFQMEKYWRRARDSIGLGDFRFHDTRHAAASWMVMGGAGIPAVGEILGHQDYQSTKRYAHLAPGHLREALEHVMLNRPASDKAALARAERRSAFGLSLQFYQAGVTLQMVEEETIRQALVACGHTMVKTARALGIARSTLTVKMAKYGIRRAPGGKEIRVLGEGQDYPVQYFHRGLTLRKVEEITIRQALAVLGYNQAAAAKALGISRSTLASKMESYRILTPRQCLLKEEDDQGLDHLVITRDAKPLRQVTKSGGRRRDSGNRGLRNRSRSRRKRPGAPPRSPSMPSARVPRKPGEPVPHTTQPMDCMQTARFSPEDKDFTP